jgi:hypothetical protein
MQKNIFVIFVTRQASSDFRDIEIWSTGRFSAVEISLSLFEGNRIFRFLANPAENRPEFYISDPI